MTANLNSGTCRESRIPAALDIDLMYEDNLSIKKKPFSVEERSLADLFQFAQKYSGHLLFYDSSDRIAGDWTPFFKGEPKQIADFVKDPQAFMPEPFTLDETKAKDEAHRQKILQIRELSKPHLALFLSFLKMLRHPQKQFCDLTARHLNFCYREILQLKNKTENPDKVLLAFEAAPEIEKHLLPKGTLVLAGKDKLGKALHYSLQEDIIVSRAKLKDLRTLAVDKQYTDLKTLHLQIGKTEKGFEAILQQALGYPKQGDSLPPYPYPNGKPATISVLEKIYSDIQSISVITDTISIFINQLYMTIEDFSYLIATYKKPKPTDKDWQKVYEILEQAFKNKNLNARYLELKQKREKQGFIKMLEFALGWPDSGNPLPPMPKDCDKDIKILYQKLKQSYAIEQDSIYARYVRKYLNMKIGDFIAIMEVYNKAETKGKAKESDWKNVYETLEKARAQKRGYQYPKVGKTELKNIYAKSDIKDEKALKLFKTFGEYNDKDGKKDGKAEKLEQTRDHSLFFLPGFRLSSPLLFLKQGERTITIQLSFKKETYKKERLEEILQKDGNPFDIYISAENQWQKIDNYQLSANKEGISVKLSFDEEFPPISPIEGYAYPCVKFFTKNLGETYHFIKTLVPEKVDISANVKGLKDIKIRNDEGRIPSNFLFMPFGSEPHSGSAFYLSEDEIASRKLDSLSLNITWLPDISLNLKERYKKYIDSGIVSARDVSKDPFKVQLSLFSKKKLKKVDTEKELFSDLDLNKQTTLTFNDLGKTALYERSENKLSDRDDPIDMPGYFKLVLQNDFMHSIYPLVTQVISKIARTEDPIVYQPYTPVIQTISLDYQASASIDLAKVAENNQLEQSTYEQSTYPDKIDQIHPFGHLAIKPLKTDQPGNITLFQDYDYEGALFIGLSSVKPPEDVSLLFQFAAGTADSEQTQPEVNWTYLSDKGWEKFTNEQILSDSTMNMLHSGILKFSIPENASVNNTIMPQGMHWIRGIVPKNRKSFYQTLDIRAQAVSAVFKNMDNELSHLKSLLPPHSIKEPAKNDPAIVRLSQPYSSFGGRPEEDNRLFHTRVSERLRHKNRAISPWDYERIVLENFPEIYRVKCLNNSDIKKLPDYDPKTGIAKMEIVVIPDVSSYIPFIPLEPKAPSYLLEKIEALLQKLSSPLISIKVKNPRYQHLKYKIKVCFKKGYARGYYLNVMNEDIKRFLSPWAYGAQYQGSLSFGSEVYNSSIIHYLEKKEYIDYLAEVKFYEPYQDKEHKVSDSTVAELSFPDSVLVSASQHELEPII
ncbi:MAG: hypothetical protein HN417_08795 [Desulfobacula sp.]|nr:hypothetical protein [Desulfobacula sp.]